jgi:c-di-GMP-binding flagellar brake protein YcgR
VKWQFNHTRLRPCVKLQIKTYTTGERAMIEKRQTPRIKTDLRLLSISSNLSTDSHITNMSVSGAFIASSWPLLINSELDLHIQLPDDPDIMSADARVVWNHYERKSALDGMGVLFTNIHPKQQQKLAAFIEKNRQADMGNH